MVASPTGRSSAPTRVVSNTTMPSLPLPLPLHLDPIALLDSLDTGRRSRRVTTKAAAAAAAAAAGSNKDTPTKATVTATTFDPIEFLNQHYTAESALVAQLPALRDAVSTRMLSLDNRISHAIQHQAETADRTRTAVQDSKAMAAALQHRILQVKLKAADSEKAVREITADMKKLDCAKKHLQRTITTLKQLHMLVHAVEQLRWSSRQTPFADYKTASHLCDAVRLLLAHFGAYSERVEPMRVLNAKVDQLHHDLRTSLVHGFRVVAFGHAATLELEGTTATIKTNQTKDGADHDVDDDGEAATAVAEHAVMTANVMEGGILFIDALGYDVRAQFIHEFCQDHISDYLKQFAPAEVKPKQEKRVSSFKAAEIKLEPAKPASGLDSIEKRFVWFRGVLQQVDRKFPIFPPAWNLQASMARHFLRLSRDHILALLDGPRKDPDAENATILLKALQKTIVFEKEMSAWLQRECGAVFVGDADATGTTTGGAQESIEPIVGVASAAFHAYMRPYIELEEQSMDEQLVEALEDRTVDTRGERPVFTSSTNIFVYIKGSITRCTALTKGNAFYLLYRAFKDALHKYAQILNSKLPSQFTTQATAVGGISIAGTAFGSKEFNQPAAVATYRIPTGEEVMVCHVITTCEYCADTLEALEDLIRDTIDDEYKAKIDMLEDQEAFHDITAKAIRVLVSGLTTRVDNALKTMASTNWSMFDMVGEESAYVLSMRQEIEPFVISVRKLLPTSYFRSFCDKFAMSFTVTYYENLIRLKKISEPGTQQLLLDVYNLKTLFLKLPVLEEASAGHLVSKKAVGTGSTIAPAMFVKVVQKQFGKMETLLKLVGTPIDLLIDNFRVQWVGGTALDLQIVTSLKGMKRMEQAAVLEKFGMDPANALKGATTGVTSATIVSERVQALQDQGSNVAAKVNSDLHQMRQKVDDFRKSFR